MPAPLEDGAERGLPVGRNHRLVSLRFEVEPETVSDVLFVFDDEDPVHRKVPGLQVPGRSVVSGSDTSRGSSSVRVAPRPSPSLWANTLPPCARAIVRTM